MADPEAQDKLFQVMEQATKAIQSIVAKDLQNLLAIANPPEIA